MVSLARVSFSCAARTCSAFRQAVCLVPTQLVHCKVPWLLTHRCSCWQSKQPQLTTGGRAATGGRTHLNYAPDQGAERKEQAQAQDKAQQRADCLHSHRPSAQAHCLSLVHEHADEAQQDAAALFAVWHGH